MARYPLRLSLRWTWCTYPRWGITALTISVAAAVSCMLLVASWTKNLLPPLSWLERAGTTCWTCHVAMQILERRTLLCHYASSWLQLPKPGFSQLVPFPNMNNISVEKERVWPLYWIMDMQQPSFSSCWVASGKFWSSGHCEYADYLNSLSTVHPTCPEVMPRVTASIHGKFCVSRQYWKWAKCN